MTSGDASTIKFGAGLAVTDEGADTIRVDATDTRRLAIVTIEHEWVELDPPQFDVTIPGNYSDLLIILSLRSAEGISNVILNNDRDSAGNYYYGPPHVAGDSVVYDGLGDNKIRLYPNGPNAAFGQYSQYTILIPGYASTAWRKTFQVQGVVVSTTADGKRMLVYELLGGFWDSTAAINRVAIDGYSFAIGSQLRIYGSK